MNQEQIKELKERLERHKKTCREWKLAGKDYDENFQVPFFCSEIEARQIKEALELQEKILKRLTGGHGTGFEIIEPKTNELKPLKNLKNPK